MRKIVARICGKHSNACINRWTKSLKPTITKGKWSLQEDESLKTAVALVGTHWKSVADRVRGRTDAQCRERWTNVLDPVLAKKKAWTKEVNLTSPRHTPCPSSTDELTLVNREYI